MGNGIDKISILFLVHEDRIVEHLKLLGRNEVIHKTSDEICLLSVTHTFHPDTYPAAFFTVLKSAGSPARVEGDHVLPYSRLHRYRCRNTHCTRRCRMEIISFQGITG